KGPNRKWGAHSNTTPSAMAFADPERWRMMSGSAKFVIALPSLLMPVRMSKLRKRGRATRTSDGEAAAWSIELEPSFRSNRTAIRALCVTEAIAQVSPPRAESLARPQSGGHGPELSGTIAVDQQGRCQKARGRPA